MSLWYLTFRILPKSLLSLIVGFLTRLRLPKPFSTWVVGAFAGYYKLNMQEAERALNTYTTIEDVFTRALKPGARSFADAYASPADGTLVRSLSLRNGEALQAKDWWYKAKDLAFGKLSSDARAQGLDFSYFTTIYLAPHNYHRVHAPFSGMLTAVRHIPGRLWPVNERFVGLVPGLFVENERLTFDFDLGAGAKAWVVMVGALNVGRMRTPFLSGFHTNTKAIPYFSTVADYPMPAPVPVKLGAELGTFMLGSTVVIILNKAAENLLKPKPIEHSQLIVLGQSLR